MLTLFTAWQSYWNDSNAITREKTFFRLVKWFFNSRSDQSVLFSFSFFVYRNTILFFVQIMFHVHWQIHRASIGLKSGRLKLNSRRFIKKRKTKKKWDENANNAVLSIECVLWIVVKKIRCNGVFYMHVFFARYFAPCIFNDLMLVYR